MNAFDAALTEAGVPHEIMIYEGQPHAFVENAQGVKSGGAQAEAWNQMLRFLETNLKNKIGGTGELAWLDYRAPFDWKYYALLVYEHAFGTARHTH